ncbi:4379_t:CDS:2, partial [Entrophospora sp. SA101]
EFSEEIKDYITGLIDDLDSNNNNETDLREVTEQFLVDAGIPKNDIEKLYIDLAANNIVKNSDNDKELEKLSNKILNKINQISNKETKTNTNNINSNVDKKSKKQLINTASTNDDSKKTAVEEVDLKDVNVIVGDKELLVDAHVKFKTGVHYGLIGRNGVGKSTFLKSIGYNKLVGFPKNIRVLYIEQLESVEEKTTVLETVVKADKERTRLLHEKQILQNAIESNEIKKIEFAVKSVNLEKLQMDLDLSRKIAIQRSGRRGLDARQDLVNVEAKVEEAQNALKSLGQDQSVDYTAIIHEMLEEVYTKLDQIKADSAEARAQEILVGLGFSDKLQHSPISSLSSLSGGWQMRVALAQALFLQPDILLLDEPTNHLDLPAILWLQSYLNTLFDTTIIIVSHDRRFLNNTVTEIIRLKDAKLTYHTGNYDEYEKNQQDERIKKERMYESQEKQKKHLEASIQKAQKKAKESGDDKKLGMVAARKKKLERVGMNKSDDGFRFKLNKHRAGYFNSVRDEIVLEREETQVSWKIPEPTPLRHHGSLLQVENVSFKYPKSKQFILKNVTLNITETSKLGFVGSNGDGKSTLMNLFTDNLQPTKGMINRHSELKIGYFAQHHVDSLDLEISADTHLREKYNISESESRSYLGKFGISGDLAIRPMRSLSGGQKSRVAFSSQVYNSPNLLILDEITNHLDMLTVETLVKVIGDFKGAVLIVSHDRWFVENVCDTIYLVKNNMVKELEGGVDEYVRGVAKEIGIDTCEFDEFD